MGLIGWYYLHENGELIYKRDFDDTVADLRESTFVRMFWPVDPEDREGAWSILVGALALGANAGRIGELAEKWKCTDEDAMIYAETVGCVLGIEGNHYTATKKDFINLHDSPRGFGNTRLEAMADLCKQIGYRESKMWGNTFKDLLAK